MSVLSKPDWHARRPLIATLDEAQCPKLALLPRGDSLALALWWLIESVADEFQMPPAQAADEVAMLCGMVKERRMRSH